MKPPIESAELAEGPFKRSSADDRPPDGPPAPHRNAEHRQPLQRSWNVTHFQIPPEAAVGVTTPFAASHRHSRGPYDYKRVDVLVLTDEGILGIGGGGPWSLDTSRIPGPE